MDQQDEKADYFWLNGRVLNLETGKEWTDVDDAVIRVLGGNGSEWGPVLARSVCRFITDMYLARRGGSHDPLWDFHEKLPCEMFEGQIRDLYSILEIVISEPLAVWVSDQEELADGTECYALRTEPAFAKVLDLAHIRSILLDSSNEVQKSMRRIRILEADYNKQKKSLVRRGGSGAAIKGGGLTLGAFSIWYPREFS
ncbi:MAG: hypothetical protein JWL81_2088 [Verrucomicrobiales bacterium]|nr:hypothetical protein [Verrucomicrobiales bacterium]